MERLPVAMLEAGTDQARHPRAPESMHGVQRTTYNKKQDIWRDHILAGHAVAEPAEEVYAHECNRRDGETFLRPNCHRYVFSFHNSPGRPLEQTKILYELVCGFLPGWPVNAGRGNRQTG